MPRLVLLGFLLLNMVSCHAWEPSAEDIARICGPVSKTSSIIRFKEPDNDALYSDKLYDFSVYFQGSTGLWQPLKANERGCLEAPEEEGTLVARSQGQSWVYAQPFHHPMTSRYQEIQLKESGNPSWTLTCPDGGWLASDSLDDILSYKGSASEAYKISLEVQSESKELAILSKPIGLGLKEFPSRLDVSQLQPGRYEMRLLVQTAGPATDPGPPVARCPLEIIRHEPSFREPAWTDGAIFPNGTLRPASLTVASDRLMLCREPGYTTSLDQECRPSGPCQNPDNFVETDGFKFDSAGPWTYLYYAKNRVGSKGKVECRRVYVSEKAPDFSLRWTTPAWNDPEHIESSIPAVLEAQIDFQGHSLDDGRPNGRLSCKVDFLSKGRIAVSGTGVRCLSGLCEGKGLDDFVPCSSPLQFSVAGALDSDLLLNSEIRLTVNADDGAGQISTQVRSLLLQHNQNFLFSTAEIFGSSADFRGVRNFWYREGGGLLAEVQDSKNPNRFFQVARMSAAAQRDRWQEVTVPFSVEPVTRTENITIQTKRKDIITSWMFTPKGEKKSRNEFFRLENDRWMPFTFKGWDPINKWCLEFRDLPDGSFICADVDKGGILYRLSVDEDPIRIANPAKDRTCESNFSRQWNWQQNSKQELFFFCKAGSFYKLLPDLTWQTFEVPEAYTVLQVAFSQQGDPLVLYRNGQELVMMDPAATGQLRPLPGLPAEEMSSGLIILDRDKLRAGRWKWTEGDDSWRVDTALTQTMAEESFFIHAVEPSANSWLAQSKSSVLVQNHDDRFRLFPRKALRFLPPPKKELRKAKLGPLGELCFLEGSAVAHIRCVLRKPWVQAGSPWTQFNASAYNTFASESKGILWSSPTGIKRRSASQWLTAFPAAPEAGMLYDDGQRLWLSAKNKVFRYEPDRKNWTAFDKTPYPDLLRPGDETHAPFTDKSGQVWFPKRIIEAGGRSFWAFFIIDGEETHYLTLPSAWSEISYFPNEGELIVFVKFGLLKAESFKIFGIDMRTRKIREHSPDDWGFDFSFFAGQDIETIKSRTDRDSVLLFSGTNRDFKPTILDFRHKKQIPVSGLLFVGDSLAIDNFQRLSHETYLMIRDGEFNGRYRGMNKNFSVINSQGEIRMIFDTNDMRDMEARPDIEFDFVAEVTRKLPGRRLWVSYQEIQDRPTEPELWIFDLKALQVQTIWGAPE